MAASTEQGTEPQSLMITSKQAARILGVSAVTMRRWVASGHVPSKKISGRRFISRKWLEDFLDDAYNDRSGAYSKAGGFR